MLAILSLLFAVTAGLDIFCTERILRKNPDGELNPFAKWLNKHVGPNSAAIAAVLLPRAVLVSICALTHNPLLFAALAGAYTDHGWKQAWGLSRGLI